MGVKLQRPGESGHPGGNRRIFVRVNHRGKRKTRVFNTTKAAEAYASQVEAWLKIGEAEKVFAPPAPPPEFAHVPTFEDAVERWERLDAVTVSPGTRDTYCNIIRRRLLPTFGGKPLADITLRAVEDWWARQLSAGYSQAHLTNMRNVAVAVFRRAVLSGLAASNPTEGIQGRLPKHAGEVRQAEWLTPAELTAVLARATVLEPRHYPMLLVLGTCGLRFGEAWGLQVGDLDVPGGRLYVRRSIRKHVVGSPKTRQARTVSVPPTTMAVLGDWIVQVRAEAALAGWEALWLFPGATGRPIEDKAVRRAFTRCLAAAGLTRRIRLHDLRHTVASLAIQQGVPLLVVSRQLGHASVSITADIYGHLAPDATRQAADALEAVINPLPDPTAGGAIRNPRATDEPAAQWTGAKPSESLGGLQEGCQGPARPSPPGKPRASGRSRRPSTPAPAWRYQRSGVGPPQRWPCPARPAAGPHPNQPSFARAYTTKPITTKSRLVSWIQPRAYAPQAASAIPIPSRAAARRPREGEAPPHAAPDSASTSRRSTSTPTPILYLTSPGPAGPAPPRPA